MSVAFASRNPSPNEVERLRLILSTFRDGSGMIAVGDETFPGWRDFERAIAIVLGGRAPETKGIFDVVIPSSTRPNVDYGLSVKSKAYTTKGGLTNLAADGRVYMELSNSAAKFRDALSGIGFTDKHFRAKKRSQEAGDMILQTVTGWHKESVQLNKTSYGRDLDLAYSRYLVLSYCLPKKSGEQHEYQWHSFDLQFPDAIKWKYASDKCLRGFDPVHTKEPLLDFYMLSGGQLKYYPRATTAIYSSPVFQLAESQKMHATLRAAKMYPQSWLAAGGLAELSRTEILKEFESIYHLAANDLVRSVIEDAIAKLRALAP